LKEYHVNHVFGIRCFDHWYPSAHDFVIVICVISNLI
jgi:hypothetical protein